MKANLKKNKKKTLEFAKIHIENEKPHRFWEYRTLFGWMRQSYFMATSPIIYVHRP